MNPTCDEEHVTLLTSAEQQFLIHRRAVHFSHGVLRRTHKLCRGFDYPYKHHPHFCSSCPAGNSTYPTLNTKRSRASQPLERVHTDIWGPTHKASINGNRFVICFVDDYSRHIAVYFIKHKSQAVDAFRQYIDEHSVPLQLNIRQLQSDGGGEYHGPLADLCRLNGCTQIFSSPDLQQQNSVAERTWRTLSSATLRMLEDAQLPAEFFEDAMRTAAWTKNRMFSTAVDGMTPHEAMWSEQPDLSLLKVWGSPAYVHIPHGKRVKLKQDALAERKTKLQAKARPTIFTGYAPRCKAWQFYDPNTKSYVTSRVATFNERVNDDTSTLKLLKQPQPADLELSTLETDFEKATLPTDIFEPTTQPVPAPVARATRSNTKISDVPLEGRNETSTSTSTSTSSSTSTATPENVRWTPTPRDDMTIKQIARYFGVNGNSYYDWVITFSPFGTDNDGKPESMKLAPMHARKPTRFERGTDVPCPISNKSFARSHANTERRRNRHSLRQRHKSVHEAYSVYLVYALTVTSAHHTLAFPEIHHSMITPTNFGKVKQSKERDQWWEAMNAEYTSLIGLGTWELQKREPSDTVIGSMWSYKIKEKSDGSIDKFKARLVARGDQQAASTFTDIFAPVIKFVTLRVLLAIACIMDWDLQQIDIGNAYCNAFVTEDYLLMRQPAGFEQYGPNGEELVCRLRKSLYGLKQAGRQWNSLLNDWLINSKWKLKRARSDYCLYYANVNDKVLLVGCYVDDLVITGNDPQLIQDFKTDIGKRFKITDMGALKWILGMEVVRDRKKRTLTLHQRKYINDILNDFNMQECNPRLTPADPSARLSKEDSPQTDTDKAATDTTLYRRMVGKLVYLMVASEPMISFAVSQLSRFFSCPGPKHFAACKYAIAYLKGIRETQGLVFRGDVGFDLHAYCDSDWAGCPDTRRSTSGYAIMFAGAAISWLSKRQPTVALSSAEAEYVTACLACQETQWIRQMLTEIGVPISKEPTVVLSDSQSAIAMANNPTAGRAKHIDIKYHFVKEARENKVVSFKYVPTNQEAADAFTKSLARPKFVEFRNTITGNVETLHVHAIV